MKVWINAGELSGDIQAAEFLKEFKKLAPNADVIGMGGENLARAGMKCLFRTEDLSVMGIVEVLAVFPKIIRLLREIKIKLKEERPDAVFLTDTPDFNFFVARYASTLGIPVYYFIPPKVWAWRTRRIHFLRKHVRKIFSILPFEMDFYKKHGIDVEYVGNPLVSLVSYDTISSVFPVTVNEEGKKVRRIGILPGSRKKEVESLLPEFSKTATLLQSKFSELEFYVLRAPHFNDAYLQSFWTSDVSVKIVCPENRYAFMRTCSCIMAASGTATLETALAGVPTLVAYKVSPLSYVIGKKFVKVPWISLPNLIMQKEMFPEFIQERASASLMNECLSKWLSSPKELVSIQDDCALLRDLCGDSESSKRLATAFYKDINPVG